MRLLISSLLCLSFLFSYSQDTIRIKHTEYTTVFSKSLKYPILVQWWTTKAKVSCVTPLKRVDSFSPDPKLHKESDLSVDYKGSGLDRGHVIPAADNLCGGKKVMEECFYFTNMIPQYHALNAGDWKTLETLTRQIASQKDSVMVWAGAIGVQSKIGRVSVPTKCWKVIYIKKDKQYQCYVFENNKNKQLGLPSHKISLEEMEKLTGFKFSIN
jgi:endonuclease G